MNTARHVRRFRERTYIKQREKGVQERLSAFRRLRNHITHMISKHTCQSFGVSDLSRPNRRNAPVAEINLVET